MTARETGGGTPSWRWILAEIKPRRRALAFVFAAGAAPVLLNLPALVLLQYTFDTAIPAGDTLVIVAAVAGIMVCRLTYGVLAYWAAARTAIELRDVTAALRMSLMARLHRVSWAQLPSLENASMQGRLVIDTERIENAANAAFNSVAPAIVPIIAFTAVMAWLSWPMALALSMIAPLLHLPLLTASRHVRRETSEFQSAFDHFNNGAGRLVRMLPVSKAQGTQEHALAGFRSRVSAVAKAGADMVAGHALYSQSNAAVSAVAVALVLAGGGVAVANGVMSLGSLAAFTMAASIAGGALSRMAGAVPALLAGREAMIRLGQAFDALEAEEDRRSGALKPVFPAPLVLRNVAVDLGGRPILRDVSLTVLPGKVTAVAARNGQGKSTLIAVMLGLVPPKSGDVTLGGVPLEALDPAAYRAGTGHVPQIPTLLKGSFRDNVCFGRDAIDPALLERALELSGAGEMLNDLGATLDTQIGEDGRTLSGGEGQRVAIARALVHAPQILFFDEPTNHLDDRAVDTLIARVFRPAPARQAWRPAIFVATHDPRLLAAADSVYDLAFGATVLRPTQPIKALS
jgi:ABC-type multidrug transport system fused ATPase/permease subunit